jgi:type I restriction enzyme M protein
MRKTLVSALSERDDLAAVCTDTSGATEPDPELRDTENVPLSEPVEEYFAREVRPYVPDAWINESVRDSRDGEIGKVGYEINFNRYFYEYVPPRALEEIGRDLKALNAEMTDLLREVSE